MPYMSGFGPAMAATRNYLDSLHGEVAGQGVYVGSLAVTAMIARSADHRAFTAGERSFNLPEGAEPPIVDPDELAAEYWDLVTTRDRVEVVYPPADASIFS